MTLTDLIITEIDFEMSNTRMTLELIPKDKLEWKPHFKSYSFAELGMHIGNLLIWAERTARGNSYNTDSHEEDERTFSAALSYGNILNNFDVKAAGARKSLSNLSDEQLSASWTLLSGREILFTLPRYFVIRQFIINHCIHHRAQLTVYLRLNDIPLPNLYGSTADR